LIGPRNAVSLPSSILQVLYIRPLCHGTILVTTRASYRISQVKMQRRINNGQSCESSSRTMYPAWWCLFADLLSFYAFIAVSPRRCVSFLLDGIGKRCHSTRPCRHQTAAIAEMRARTSYTSPSRHGTSGPVWCRRRAAQAAQAAAERSTFSREPCLFASRDSSPRTPLLPGAFCEKNKGVIG
jgi:hypothetical protein